MATGSSEDLRPTLEDVAAYAGVSRSTASRALNNDEYVSNRSREVVLAAAAELGYSPNHAARSLVTKRTGAVALVLSAPEAKVLDDPYFAAVIHGGFRALADAGSQMLVIFVDSKEDVQRTVRFLEGGHVDGALVFAPRKGDPLPTALKLLRLPIVYGGKPGTAGRNMHIVDFDNKGGARMAVKYLADRGRTHIATVTGPLDHSAARDRYNGWRDTLRAEELVAGDLSEAGDFTIEGGMRATRILLERMPHLDAVFAASDPMAVGAIRVLEAAGKRVPRDVPVIGFDDHLGLATALSPPLTTIHQDPREQVREMVYTLSELIAGEYVKPGTRVLPVVLTVRGSA